MKIEIKTRDHSEYSEDNVTFEDNGEFIEISRGFHSFEVRKTDLKKVVSFLAGGETNE